jgi:hypothetical protein
MSEIPLPERPLLPLDDEEILLLVLPVVRRHLLARLEHRDVQSEPVEAGLVPLEERELLAGSFQVPAGVPCVEHEPSLAGGQETVLARLERCLGNRHGSQSSRNSVSVLLGKRA